LAGFTQAAPGVVAPGVVVSVPVVVVVVVPGDVVVVGAVVVVVVVADGVVPPVLVVGPGGPQSAPVERFTPPR
jgi:hypothetical protein